MENFAEVPITEELLGKVEAGELVLDIPVGLRKHYRELQLNSPEDITAFVREHQSELQVLRMDDHYRLVTADIAKRMHLHMRKVQQRRHEKGVGYKERVGFWESRDEILRIFPEAASDFDEARTKIGSASCSSCTANKLRKTILRRIADLHLKHPEREIPPSTLELLGPIFSQIVAQTRYKGATYGALATPVPGTDGAHRLVDPPQHSHGTLGVRPSCLDCVRKHIGQAIVLFLESEQTYPAHFWLGIGHLAEASDESLASYPQFARKLREYRLGMMADPNYKPDLMSLFEELTDLADREDPLVKDMLDYDIGKTEENKVE